MSDLLITGGVLLVPTDGEEERLRTAAGDLAIRDDRILKAGDLGSLPDDFAPAATISAEGCVVMPGLVNAHCHGAMSLLRGYADDMPLMAWLQEKVWPAEAHLHPSDVYWGTALAIYEMLSGGVTAFADMYFFMSHAARAASDLGIRAALSLGITDNDDDPVGDTRRLFERWHGRAQGRISIQLGPHAPYTCGPDLLQQVVSTAEDLDCAVHMHLAETTDEISTIEQEYGMTPVQYARRWGLLHRPFVAAHCVHLQPEDIATLTEASVGIVHCPQSNQKLGSGVAPLAEMLRRGTTVGLGTDGACSTGRLDIWAEMRAAALQQKVINRDPGLITAGQSLYMATRGGARALGLDDVGLLAPDMKADVIVVDLQSPHLQPVNEIISSLTYCAGPADVRDVFVDGRQIVLGGELQTASGEEILSRAERCRADLLRRVAADAK